MARVLIGIGSNVGDRLAHMREALDRLRSSVEIIAVAPVYETEPMYVEDQPSFYNSACAADTSLSPLALLAILKEAENHVGRRSGKRYGPREIDLDLLAYGTLSYSFVAEGRLKLQIPHPKTAERRFVLAPLNDIASASVLPGLGSVRDLLADTVSQAHEVAQIPNSLFD